MTEQTSDNQSFDEQLSIIEGNLSKLEEFSGPLDTEINHIQDDWQLKNQEFLNRMAAIKKEQEEYRQGMIANLATKRDMLRKIRDKKLELQARQEKVKQAAEDNAKQVMAAANAAILEERWKSTMIAAPWREWAKDHQLKGARQWAEYKRMICADEMGLGKTLLAIIGTDLIKAATSTASPTNPYQPEEVEKYIDGKYMKQYINGITAPAGLRVLYVCPSSLIQNVIDEFKHWAPHRTIVPIANTPGLQQDFALDTANGLQEFVMLLNYESWRRNFKLIDKLVAMRLDTLVIDEAHFIKDTDTIFFRGVDKLVEESQAPFVLPMTGTPVLNKPEDVYPLLKVIDGKTFYAKNVFLNRFCEQSYTDGKWKFKSGGAASLGVKLGHQYLRRTLEDAGIVLPEQTTKLHEIEVDLEAYPLQAEARKTMKKHAFLQWNNAFDQHGEKKAMAAAAQIAVYTRLRQIETWPAGIKLVDPETKEITHLDIEESQKLDYLINSKATEGLIPQAFENNHRIVIFSQFVDVLKEMARRITLLDKSPVLFTGGQNLEERNEVARDFDAKYTDKNKFKHHAALCHYRVGGMGLNFTLARETMFMDEEWNPGKRDQAKARTRRIGQDETTIVHVIRMKATIDSWLAKLMSTKENLVEGFNAAMPSLENFLSESDESGLL